MYYLSVLAMWHMLYKIVNIYILFFNAICKTYCPNVSELIWSEKCNNI